MAVKLTQQQIEAWLRKQYVVEHSRDIDYVTAAADDLAKEFAALTAAAEVGECGCGYDNPDDVCDVHLPVVKAAIADERERCAQVVHNLQQRVSDHGDANYVFAFNDAIREAVAAIRIGGQADTKTLLAEIERLRREHDELYDEIAKAVSRERERCARVAEDWGLGRVNQTVKDYPAAAASAIAAAIRKGE